jgi:diguanylate cyclase
MRKMEDQTHQHTRSFTLGERTLDQIRRLNLAAEPASYEIWYNYFAGRNLALNRHIDGILARSGTLLESDIHEIRHRYFPGADLADRINELGKKIGDEVEQVINMIEAAIGVSDSFGTTLSGTSEAIAHPLDRQALRTIIEALVITVREVQDENGKLGANLKETHKNIAQLQGNLDLLRLESLTDPLTDIANRRYFDQFLQEAVAKAQATNAPLTLLLADIDNFKQFNDNHGHQIGDHVLRLIATAIKQSVKEQHFVARYGGEEFAVVFPDTSPADAEVVAETIRNAVATKDIVKRSSGESLGRVTISIGIGGFHSGMTAQQLIETADICLYTAKKKGRNRVVSNAALSAQMQPARQSE